MNDSMQLGRWRTARGLSAAQLAGQVGLTEQALLALENGTVPVRHTVATRLAQALGIPLPQLFDWPSADRLHAADTLPRIPVLGVIRAGVPIPATVLTGPDTAGCGGLFYLTVADDSLAAVGLGPQSRVLFSSCHSPQAGDLVVYTAGGEEPAIRRFFPQESDVVLLAVDDRQPPLRFSARDLETGWLCLLGVAEHTLHRL